MTSVSQESGLPVESRAGRHGAKATVTSVVGTVLGALLVLILLGAIFVAVASRTSGRGVPTVLGHSAVVILSGSMTPTFSAGDLVIDSTPGPGQASHLHQGEIITFAAGPPGAPASVLITHRIYKVSYVAVPPSGRREPRYETKGDANPVPDGNAVQPGQVVGVYDFRVPFGGYVLNFLHHPIVFIFLICSPFVVLVLAEASRRWRAAGDGNHGGAAM